MVFQNLCFDIWRNLYVTLKYFCFHKLFTFVLKGADNSKCIDDLASVSLYDVFSQVICLL